MTRQSALARWRARGADERRALVEAFVTLAWAARIVAKRPFAELVETVRRPVAASAPADPERACAVVAWAVAAAARRVRFRAVCIERGLAAHIMLRRRGVAAEFHYGLARAASGELSAHVWVRAGGRDVTGGEVAADFRPVAVFRPGDPA